MISCSEEFHNLPDMWRNAFYTYMQQFHLMPAGYCIENGNRFAKITGEGFWTHLREVEALLSNPGLRRVFKLLHFHESRSKIFFLSPRKWLDVLTINSVECNAESGTSIAHQDFPHEKHYCSLPPLPSWIHIQSMENIRNSRQVLNCSLKAPTFNGNSPHQPPWSLQDATHSLDIWSGQPSNQISKPKKSWVRKLILLQVLIFKPC